VPRLARLALVAALLSALAIALWMEVPLCPLAGSFGIPCPGCGLTRATLALLRGDLHAALHFHPLVFILTPLFVGFMLAAMLEFLRGPVAAPLETASAPRRVRIRFALPPRVTTAGAALLLAVTLAIWLLRFAGYFGGPVPVTTLRAWASSHLRQ